MKAHLNFSDPEWDGEPEEPVPPGPPRDPPEPRDFEQPDNGGDNGGFGDRPEKIVVRLAPGKDRTIQYIAATTYWRADGKPVSAADFLKRLFGDLEGPIADEDQFRAIWADPDNRERLLAQLDERGYDRSRLDDIRQLVDAPDSDLFDVLAHVLYANPPRTRGERADDVRQGGLDRADAELRELLHGILQPYETHGEGELASTKLQSFMIGRYGSVGEGRARLGALPAVQAAFRQMQAQLYAN